MIVVKYTKNSPERTPVYLSNVGNLSVLIIVFKFTNKIT